MSTDDLEDLRRESIRERKGRNRTCPECGERGGCHAQGCPETPFAEATAEQVTLENHDEN